MIKKLVQKIKSKKDSDNFIWKYVFILKDKLWCIKTKFKEKFTKKYYLTKSNNIKKEIYEDKNRVDKKYGNDSPPEVIIIFYGLTRSLSYTLPSIQKNIFEPLNKAGLSWHLYIHTYNQKDINNPRSREEKVKLDYKKDLSLLPEEIYTSHITSREEFFQRINLDDYTIHGDPWFGQDGNVPFGSLKNLLLQLNSLQEVTKIAKIESNSKSVYLFIRPDLFYLDPVSIELVQNCIKNINKEIIYTPQWANLHGVNDRFAITTPKGALLYGNRLDKAKEFAANQQFHSERFLDYVISGIKRESLKTRALRVRANGLIENKDIKEFKLNKNELSKIQK